MNDQHRKDDQHRKGEKKGDPRKQPQHDPRERTVGPPIEREHETQKGVFEEDEKRDSEHERH